VRQENADVAPFPNKEEDGPSKKRGKHLHHTAEKGGNNMQKISLFNGGGHGSVKSQVSKRSG
jgi:hypothetical protein